MKLVWVAGLSQTYTIGETSYGPSEGPVQIPAQLAAALGLPEVDAPTDQASTQADGAQALREARAALEGARQEVANLTTQLAEMREAGSRALNAVQEVGQLFSGITPGTDLTEGTPSMIAQHVQNVIGASKTNADEYSKYLGISQELTTERDQIRTEADQLAARVVELEAQLAGHGDGENANPGDVDQRTKAQLKEALDGKQIQYAPNTNRDGLLALAAEHQV